MTAARQAGRGDEFSERLTGAVNGMSFDTRGELSQIRPDLLKKSTFAVSDSA
jgi:hypothetical protein